MAGWWLWEARPYVIVASGLLAGYVWLTVLSMRVRALHRRLAAHTCRDPDLSAARAAGSEHDAESATGPQKITVAELLDRERGRPRRMLPALMPPAPREVEAEQTQRLARLPTAEAPPRRPSGTSQRQYGRAPGPDTNWHRSRQRDEPDSSLRAAAAGATGSA